MFVERSAHSLVASFWSRSTFLSNFWHNFTMCYLECSTSPHAGWKLTTYIHTVLYTQPRTPWPTWTSRENAVPTSRVLPADKSGQIWVCSSYYVSTMRVVQIANKTQRGCFWLLSQITLSLLLQKVYTDRTSCHDCLDYSCCFNRISVILSDTCNAKRPKCFTPIYLFTCVMCTKICAINTDEQHPHRSRCCLTCQ